MPGNFYDTNILVYLASRDPAKADAAERAIARGGLVSVQVLNEFVHVARRKMGFSWQEAHEFLPTVRSLLTVVPLTTAIHDLGLQLAERYGFPIYDAMIVAAAITNDCDVLYSEDFQNGLNVGELSIVNPLN